MKTNIKSFIVGLTTVVTTCLPSWCVAQSPTFTASGFALAGGSDSGPTCLVVADVNGDGRLDLIVSDYGFRRASPGDPGGWNTALEVLTNNGSGGFAHQATLTVGKGPTSVAAADVNGDGKVDSVLANFRDGTLTVLKNTTAFSPPSSTPTLTLQRSGNAVQVTWPAASPGWSLQQNMDLTTPNWLPSGYAGHGMADDGTNKSFAAPTVAPNYFSGYCIPETRNNAL